MGAGGRPLALIAAAERFLDRPAEVVLAVATIVAIACVAAGLPELLRGGSRRPGRSRITSALVVMTGGAAITFVSYLGFVLRCGNAGCQDGAGGGFAELERWWRSDDTWQWGGQLLIAALGLGLAALAFVLSARRSSGRRAALIAAWVAYGAWGLLVFGFAAVYELAT